METTGCGTAIVTPFRADQSIDEEALRALVNWQVDAGIDFLVACGSTGEAATLDEDEWLRAVRIVVEAAAGRVPVWAGCTHNCTRTLVRQARLLQPGARRRRDSLGESLLQQAHPGGSVPALHGAGGRSGAASGSALQRAGPHGRKPGAGDRGTACGRGAEYRGHQGSERKAITDRERAAYRRRGRSRSSRATTGWRWQR